MALEQKQNHLFDALSSTKKSSRHKRSKSDPDKIIKEEDVDSTPKFINVKMDMDKTKSYSDGKKKQVLDAEVQKSLKQEIMQLEKRLHDQLSMRRALEKALGYNSLALHSSADSSMPKPAKELIREIAVLELEVMYMEQYLLSLYRKAFDQQTSTFSHHTTGDNIRRPLSLQSESFDGANFHTPPTKGNQKVQSSRTKLSKKWIAEPLSEICETKPAYSAVQRSQSSLSYRTICSSKISPSEESVARALRSCHSQPLSFLEEEQNVNPGVISLAEYLGTTVEDLVPETPNKISEDMIRCMGVIFCKLADPPLAHYCQSASPASSFSSMSAVSPQYLGDMWSPNCHKRESMIDCRLINPFRIEGLKEFSGPYNTMVDVPLICMDHRRLRDVKDLLQNYKLIRQRLESVDPRKMSNEEKLAFWINIHNALIMHAYVEYGIPQDNMKRTSLLMKASCIIGGHSVAAAMIQSSFLGCQTYFPGQWLRTLLSPKIKRKNGDRRQAYAIERPEPLLHFALCSGSHSDPAVRIYTPKRLYQQLEAAKEEFIRASVGILKEQKILLPKVICLYAKDMKLSSQGLVDMIQLYLPETLRMAMQKCQQAKSSKIIDWIPHNFSFRYLLSRELAFPHINC